MLRVEGWLAAAAVSAAFAARAVAAPLAAYGDLPTIEQIAISPDGKLPAIDLVKGDQRSVLVQDIAAQKVVTGIKLGDAKVRDLRFAGDDHVIITTSKTSGMLGVMIDRSEWSVANDFNLTTHKVKALLGDVDLAGNFIESVPEIRMIDKYNPAGQ